MTSSSKKQPQKVNRAGFRLSAARLSAVQALYEIEVAGADSESVLKSFIEKRWRDVTLQDPDLKPEDSDKARLANPDPDYLTKLVQGVVSERSRLVTELDSILSGEWTAERLDTLMRMLLCLAAFEFIFQTDVPKRVLISEYASLAHAFFEDNEASFAAGILSSLATSLRPE